MECVMKKKWIAWAATLTLLFGLLSLHAAAVPGLGEEHMLRVGLAFDGGSVSALAAANLENSVDSGYCFGYFDDNAVFHPLGSTTKTQISMLKTQNLYLSGGTYSTSGSGSSVVGCYHIRLPGEYASFEDAQAAAGQFSGGFPAWVDGVFQARVGAYPTKEDAVAAQTSLGLSEGSVVGTSSAAVSVVVTGTTQILFQFDGGGQGLNLAVQPGLENPDSAVTWFKGWKYYGAFEYIRNGSGGNITVVNWIPMEQYVKGVVPYEIGGSRPLEAMKAQAVCNRTYAALQYMTHKHGNKGFDLCNTTDCQVYHGAGSSTSKPTAQSDLACEETANIYAWYNGSYAQTYYYSSNGGATEQASNVWNEDLPYLIGQADPYEAYVADQIPQYRWSYTYTSAELSSILNQKGYAGTVTDFYVSKFTAAGNVYSITFVCSNGKSYTFSKERARTILGMSRSSMHFTVTGGSGESSVYINSGSKVSGVGGLYAIDGNGGTATLPEGAYVITSEGTSVLTASSSGGNGTWTVSGSGWGHNVGMSQWGAISMGLQGYSYEEILAFYYPGVNLGTY